MKFPQSASNLSTRAARAHQFFSSSPDGPPSSGTCAQVSHETIVGIEGGRANVKEKTIEKVRAALEKAGCIFFDVWRIHDRIRGDAKHAAALLFVADIVGILILLLEERIVAGFDFDIVIRHDRNPVVADIGFNEQIQHGFCARWRLAVIDHCRCAKSTFRLEA
jgi:hypothetical protein